MNVLGYSKFWPRKSEIKKNYIKFHCKLYIKAKKCKLLKTQYSRNS